MESKKSKRKVFDDDLFGTGIDLQGASNINTDRRLATEDEIEQLILPEKLTKIERVKRILTNGDKLQKWSVFENFLFYADDSKYFTKLLEIFNGESREMLKDKQLLGMMGYGLANFFETPPYPIKVEEQELVYQLIEKMFKYEQAIITDQWVETLRYFILQYPKYITQAQEFVNGSFDFKASPERRRTALLIMEVLFDHSQKIRKQTVRKIFLFNEDHNKVARRAICAIVGKYLKQETQNEEAWKIIWEYTNDKESTVRDTAYRSLSLYRRNENFANILVIFDQQFNVISIASHLKSIIQTYRDEFSKETTYVQMLNITNRLVRSKQETLIEAAFNIILEMHRVYSKKYLSESIDSIKQVEYENKVNTVAFIKFYANLGSKEDDQYRYLLYNIVKLHSYDLPEAISPILQVINYENDMDFELYIRLCVKMFDNSKWVAIGQLLKCVFKWRLTRNMLDRMALFLLKLILVSPYFLLQTVFESYRLLLLSSRKKLDFMSNLKQKLSVSKVCTHRRNYLLLYSYIYKHCSWQAQKLLPPVIFSYLLNQKILTAKLEYARTIPIIYQYIDPSEIQFKANLRQLLKKYTQDKDQVLVQISTISDIAIAQIDSNIEAVQQRALRNKNLIQLEKLIPQAEQQLVEPKEIQTQKNLLKPNIVKKSDTKKTSILITKVIPVKQLPKSYSATVKTPLPTVYVGFNTKKESKK